MKTRIIKLVSAMLMLLFICELKAQVPQAFNYQAVARDNFGNLIVSHAVGIQIIIHQTTASGTPVYSETFATSTNQFGLFTIAIGKGTPVSGTFSSITWSTGNYWLEVQLDPSGGSSYTSMGTSQLLTVPYAMYAVNAGVPGVTGPTGPTGATGSQGVTGPTGGYIAHAIGDSYGGGIVFYVYDGGQHGLIAATADQSYGIVWSTSYSVINADRDCIGAGKFNTERIIANQGAVSYAAQICSIVQLGNFGDWYLPSKYELNLLYLQKTVVGGFASGMYWSSYEGDADHAWDQNFSNGTQAGDDKGNLDYVRVIRAF
jgi:Protein of unknown function (DUF1566)